MTNPTTPFSWQMPTSTDLVTDLPADFETFGQAVATSMADLLGGTTGQVLSKATNADMDFTWVTSDDANAIQNAIVDAKGDLIAASAADTPARLAVGNNGETLVADSSTSTGLRYQAPVNSNPVLNSAAQIWQRGTSIGYLASVGYFADRWYGYCVPSATFSRQTTNDTTNLPFIQYCMRMQRTAGNTSTGLVQISQSFETINSIAYAGKTITFSFYARRGANFSAASNLMTAFLVTGTGTDQNISVGYTGGANAIFQTPALTTTWTRYTYTATIPTTSTEIAVGFDYTPTGTAGAADYFEITGVQVEVGSVATPFKTYAGTLQGELAACQRYYWRTSNTGYGHYSLGYAELATQLNISFSFPSTMRTVPSVSSSAAGTLAAYRQGGFIATTSVMTYNQGSTNTLLAYATTAAASLTQFSPYVLFSNNTSSYVEFSAEL